MQKIRIISLFLALALALAGCGSTPPSQNTNAVISNAFKTVYGGEQGDLPTAEIRATPALKYAFERWNKVILSPPSEIKYDLSGYFECPAFTMKDLDNLSNISKFDEKKKLDLFEQLQDSNSDDLYGNFTNFKFYSKEGILCPTLSNTGEFPVNGLVVFEVTIQVPEFPDATVSKGFQVLDCDIKQDLDGRYFSCAEHISVTETVQGDSNVRSTENRSYKTVQYFSNYASNRDSIFISNNGIYSSNVNQTTVRNYKGDKNWSSRSYSGSRLTSEFFGNELNHVKKTHYQNRATEITCVRNKTEVSLSYCNE